MIFISLKGGLGNMLFQIAAGISFAKRLQTDMCLINLNSHLEYLNADNVYQPQLNHSLEYLKLNQFKKFNKTSNSENFPSVKINYPFCYIDTLPQDNCLVNGFFQSEKFFINEKEHILEDFKPTKEIEIELSKYDFSNFKTTSIHVRRGDYLKFPDLHTVQKIEYFKEAIRLTKNKTDKYVIFSDDIDWCKTVFVGNEFYFVENEKDYVEIYLMSLCDNNIISNSSFSWWGAWMNSNKNKIVIAPEKWFGPKDPSLIDKDIIPKEWIKI